MTKEKKLLIQLLLNNPGFRVCLSKVVGFPKRVWGAFEDELEESVKELVEGLEWRDRYGERELGKDD